jgi:3-oxoacyl-[acyl-carrier protein] reductase
VADAVREVEALGARGVGITADVRDEAEVERVVRETMDAFGRVDILVNVVGGAWGETFRSGPLMEIEASDLVEAYRLNVATAFMCSKAVQPIMQRQGKGVIVNIASAAGRRASPGQGAYGAAKAGLVNLTLTMAREWGPEIRVNVVAVGGLETPQRPRWSEATTTATLDRSALGRLGTPEEHAGTVVWLASDYAGYITGAVIDAHGGQV